MYFYIRPVSSPRTKSEVKAAANILIVLGIIFAMMALLGVGLMLAYHKADYLILTFVGGSMALLCFSAGAYNIYYTRRMSHAPFMAAALRHRAVTVLVIMAGITALVIGGISLLIFLR